MAEEFDLSLILPAYNEVGRIRETITQTADYLRSRGYRYEIIVAADGNDGTRELVREISKSDPRVLVIGHAERMGKGRGVREAVAIARGSIIGYADADNKVPIEEFDKIAARLDEGYQVVIGSRGMAESRIEKRQPIYRQLGSKGFRLFLYSIVGLRGILDTQCGFKFFSNTAARLIFDNQKVDGYMFDVEILVLATRFGFPIAQVPIRWQDDGDSRLELLAGNIRNVRDVFRIRRSSAWATSVHVKESTDEKRIGAK
jgi:dolichyl-phosphate beta-glucosyltransferase